MRATLRQSQPSNDDRLTKCQKVRSALEDLIRSGQSRPGSQLPGERVIARTFKVSTMTVNRAISEMVEDRWLVRRPRVGTFVHSDAWQGLSTKYLNLIANTYDSPVIRAFFQIGKMRAQEKGLTPRAIRIEKDTTEAERALEDGSRSLVMSACFPPESPIPEAMRRAAGRAVLLAGRLDNLGVHSVTGDDRHMIRMGMEHLRRLGHRAIGMVCCRRENYVERERIVAWNACHGSDARDPVVQRRLLVLDLPANDHPMERAYQIVRAFLQAKDHGTTALILPDDETAIGVLSACRDEGVRVPQDLSIISIGNTPFAEHLTPKLTSLDPDLEGEIELALRLLTEGSPGEEGLLHAVEPKLIERESTGPARH